MGLLDKYFGAGNITDRYGKNVGYITHLDNESALIHDDLGRVVGRIEERGDNIEFYDHKHMLNAVGKSYGRDDVLDLYALNGNHISTFEEYGGKSYQTNKYDYNASTIFNSDCSCSSYSDSCEPDGLGPEFWDNCDDEDDY